MLTWSGKIIIFILSPPFLIFNLIKKSIHEFYSSEDVSKVQIGLCCVSLSPQFSYSVVLLSVVDILCCDAAHEGVTGIAVRQETADGEQHLGDGQSRAPLVFQDVQANHSLGVDVAVINSRAEFDFWRLKWVICGEMYIEEENTTLINGSRRTQDCADPLIEVVSFGSRTTVGRWIQGNCSKLFLNTFCGCWQCLGHLGCSFLFFGLIWGFTLAGWVRHV